MNHFMQSDKSCNETFLEDKAGSWLDYQTVEVVHLQDIEIWRVTESLKKLTICYGIVNVSYQ